MAKADRSSNPSKSRTLQSVKLAREIRVFQPAQHEGDNLLNTWAGVSQLPGERPFWVVRGEVTGEVDPQTGYLCDIKKIDALLRETVIPLLSGGLLIGAEHAIVTAFQAANSAFRATAQLTELSWSVSPYLTLAIREETPDMVSITQSFEFSAAHRLSAAGFSEAENLRTFGKCSNPHGHGHNYILEVTINGTPDPAIGTVIELPALQRIVRERVIEPFDHRNLNVECAEFASLNPSVENIAMVIWRRLNGGFGNARLTKVRLWETPKTSAEYSGD